MLVSFHRSSLKGCKKVLQSPLFSNSWTRSHDDRLADKRVSSQQPRTGCQQVLHEWIQLSVCDDNWSVFSTKQYYYVWKTCLTGFIFGQVFRRSLLRAGGYRLSQPMHSAAAVKTCAERKACISTPGQFRVWNFTNLAMEFLLARVWFSYLRVPQWFIREKGKDSELIIIKYLGGENAPFFSSSVGS